MTSPVRKLPLSLILGLIGIAALSMPCGIAAQSPGQREAIESAREELGSGANPWYDAEKDSLRKVKVERVQRRAMPLGWLLKGIVYALLALAIAAIVYALVRFAMEQLKSRKLAEDDEKSQPRVDEAEALPFLAERPRGDLLGLARQHYEQGNYSEAIIYLFSYELVELDRGSRIHLAKGKTNRQYLRELKDAAPLRGALERTLHAFESVFFGRRNLDRAGFEACWHELPQFQAQLRGAT
jgi:hypothetical protein